MELAVCVAADLHGNLPRFIPPCDLLVLSGDICPEINAYEQIAWLDRVFRPWLKAQPVKQGTVAVWGNHDQCGINALRPQVDELHLRWHLLTDERVLLAGIKIYGSPWQPRFGGVYNMNEPDLERVWSRIPDDTQLLVLHGPPHGFGDMAHGSHKGSRSLTRRIRQVRPALVTFGHIHEGRGEWNDAGVTLVNASLMDGTFQIAYDPWVGMVDFAPGPLRSLPEVYCL
jgi:Icc-related predicted phosphoesterase